MLLGLPGKLGMSGDRVWDFFLQGKVTDIKNYCETDVLNTYLVYLRFQLMRGVLDESQYGSEIQLVKQKLQTSKEAHLQEFLSAWNGSANG
jgi:predicted PolB exonuclease-like 3'-5' exonuclease